MRLFRPSRQARSGSSDERLVPLINIVFLLLIFFMIAGRVVPPGLFAVEPPQARVGEPELAQAWVVLVGADSRLALDGASVTTERLIARLTEAGRAGAMPVLTLKADAGLHVGALRTLLHRLREADLEQIRLVTVPAH